MFCFKQRHIEVRYRRSGGHTHCNAFVLFDDGVVELHAIVQHYEGEGFCGGNGGEVGVCCDGCGVEEEV